MCSCLGSVLLADVHPGEEQSRSDPVLSSVCPGSHLYHPWGAVQHASGESRVRGKGWAATASDTQRSSAAVVPGGIKAARHRFQLEA